MKVKKTFFGNTCEVPRNIQKSFLLNDRYHSAKLTLDFLGNYMIDVPYGVTDATARRSVYYKSAINEVTRQMMNAYSSATDAFTMIASKCVKIESDVIYQKRLHSLCPETYSKRPCPEPQPTKALVEKELIQEADKKFYRLFSSNTSAKKKYISENLETMYQDRLRHWEEVVTYYDYVETILAAKKNKAYYEQFISTKTDLENRIYGPDEYVKQQITDTLQDKNIPFRSLPFELDYNQKDGLLNLVVDVPVDVPIPRETAQLYATGKISIKSKPGKDLKLEKTKFYLGLAFYLASKCFSLALNIKKVRVSLVELPAALGLLWIEFDRDILQQLILSGYIDLYASALSFNHYFDIDDVNGLRRIHIGQYNKEVDAIIKNAAQPLQKPVTPKRSDINEISIDDAKLIAATIHDNGEIQTAIDESIRNLMSTVKVSRNYASMLEEIKSSGMQPSIEPDSTQEDGYSSSYGEIEYKEYMVTETIPESDAAFISKIKAFIQSVIDQEAPISRDLLNRRICAAMGISRVSARLNEKLVSILIDMKLLTTTDGKLFFWSNNTRPDNYKAYRKGGNRDALDIAPQEIANCMAYNIDCSGNTDKDFVIRDTANEFGFSRLGTNVVAAMENGILYGETHGILSVRGNGIYSNI